MVGLEFGGFQQWFNPGGSNCFNGNPGFPASWPRGLQQIKPLGLSISSSIEEEPSSQVTVGIKPANLTMKVSA